jgi:hypothetical protein
MELRGQAYEYLLQLYLDRRARDLYDVLSRYLAMQIYQGYWYDLATTAALAAVETFAGLVSGTVTLRLSLAAPPPGMRPAMAARIRLVVGDAAGVGASAAGAHHPPSSFEAPAFGLRTSG